MVRKGLLDQPVWAFAQLTGRSPATIKRYEANTAEAPDDFLQKVAELSEVPLEWIKNGEGDFPPANDQVVRARLKRAVTLGAAQPQGALATGSGEVARYPSALEKAAESMPPSEAVKSGRVSIELLAQVVETIENWLHENRAKVRLTPSKKAMLIAVAYTHFEGREFEKREMAQFFRLVA